MNALENNLGFWSDTPVKLEKLVLNPYKPRPAISFELLTDEDLEASVDDVMGVDVECFNNFFLQHSSISRAASL